MLIELQIPNNTYENEHFNKILQKVNKNDSKIKFTNKEIPNPLFNFEINSVDSKCFKVGGLPLCFNYKNYVFSKIKYKKPKIEKINDIQGEYLKITHPNYTYYQLSFKQLFERIGKI